ncbi:hypothetical protein [Microtetraspora malaysiensis]|uniref:hypothetical protein n=1 Tax=Microtetraspora malaysiensis TaxID=161358 RepID=UPI003D8E3752
MTSTEILTEEKLRLVDERSTAMRSPAASETPSMYETCPDAQLIVTQKDSVGLLRKGDDAGPEQCAAAASGASLGTLRIDKHANPEEAGASLRAVTSTGCVARSTITKITYAGTYSIPAVEFKLTTWVRE